MRFPRLRNLPTIKTPAGTLCRQCGALIPPGYRSYCSTSCRTQFTRDHWWPLIRLDVLRRDGFRCSICGKKRGANSLDIDHIVPIQMGADPYDKANLRTLCKECHKAKTKLDRDALR